MPPSVAVFASRVRRVLSINHEHLLHTVSSTLQRAARSRLGLDEGLGLGMVATGQPGTRVLPHCAQRVNALGRKYAPEEEDPGDTLGSGGGCRPS